MYLPTYPSPFNDTNMDDSSPVDVLQAHSGFLVASFSAKKIIELCELNKHKTCFAHSVAEYDVINQGMFSINRSRGELNYNKLNDIDGYCIVYMQFINRVLDIQPASKYSATNGHNEHFLWQIGNLTKREVNRLQFEEETKENWDTMLLLKHLIRYEEPSSIEGSFSCIYSDSKNIFIFRNQNAPMFIDKNFTICTSAFVGSETTSSDKIFQLDLEHLKLKIVGEFETVKDWQLKQ